MPKNFLTLALITILFFCATSNAQAQEDLSQKLSGHILLQVEQNGEAWYVNPEDNQRHSLGRPADAFEVMREQGVGITSENLDRIPVGGLDDLTGEDSDEDGLPDAFEEAIGTDLDDPDTDGDGHNDQEEIQNGYNPKDSGKLNTDTDFAQKQAGKILLQAEDQGQAWYINPEDNQRYFLGRPADAFQVMRNLGQGISDDRIESIEKSDSGESSSESDPGDDGDDPDIDLSVTSNQEVYEEGDTLEITINVSSTHELDTLKVRAQGISNKMGHYFFDKEKEASLSSGETETVNMSETVPECSACTGIETGPHDIEVELTYEEEKVAEEKVEFEIQ